MADWQTPNATMQFQDADPKGKVANTDVPTLVWRSYPLNPIAAFDMRELALDGVGVPFP